MEYTLRGLSNYIQIVLSVTTSQTLARASMQSIERVERLKCVSNWIVRNCADTVVYTYSKRFPKIHLGENGSDRKNENYP